MIVVSGNDINFFKYFVILSEISSYPQLDWDGNSSIILLIVDSLTSSKQSLLVGLFFKKEVNSLSDVVDICSASFGPISEKYELNLLSLSFLPFSIKKSR